MWRAGTAAVLRHLMPQEILIFMLSKEFPALNTDFLDIQTQFIHIQKNEHKPTTDLKIRLLIFNNIIFPQAHLWTPCVICFFSSYSQQGRYSVIPNKRKHEFVFKMESFFMTKEIILSNGRD